LFQQLSSAAVAASQRNHQSSTLPQQAQQQSQQQQTHHQHHNGQSQSSYNQSSTGANTSANGQDHQDSGGGYNPLGATPTHVRMLQQGAAQSWRSPFLLDPSIPVHSNGIKQEQIHYGYPSATALPNNANSSSGMSSYQNQLTNLAAANSVGSNSSAAAAAAAAAMFYPIELGDSNMFGRINVPFNSNGNANQPSVNNNGPSLRQQQRHNLSSHSINGK
jgi:hypothetical protein